MPVGSPNPGKLRRSSNARLSSAGECGRSQASNPATFQRRSVRSSIAALDTKRKTPTRSPGGCSIGRYEFGIEEPLLERPSPKDLIGELEARERALSDDELHAVWHAASADSEKMGFPYGPLVRF